MDNPSVTSNGDAEFSNNIFHGSKNHSKLQSFFTAILFVLKFLFKLTKIFIKILACVAENKIEEEEERERKRRAGGI